MSGTSVGNGNGIVIAGSLVASGNSTLHLSGSVVGDNGMVLQGGCRVNVTDTAAVTFVGDADTGRGVYGVAPQVSLTSKGNLSIRGTSNGAEGVMLGAWITGFKPDGTPAGGVPSSLTPNSITTNSITTNISGDAKLTIDGRSKNGTGYSDTTTYNLSGNAHLDVSGSGGQAGAVSWSAIQTNDAATLNISGTGSNHAGVAFSSINATGNSHVHIEGISNSNVGVISSKTWRCRNRSRVRKQHLRCDREIQLCDRRCIGSDGATQRLRVI